jgi:predicted 2-oxoglutarate/Fe(II)-dependent dioxygenase YbiX
MLEKSDDLMGGTLNVWLPREGTVLQWDGKYMVDLEVGETIMFPAYFLHEVTPLVQGERKVLISWGQIGTQHYFTEVAS